MSRVAAVATGVVALVVASCGPAGDDGASQPVPPSTPATTALGSEPMALPAHFDALATELDALRELLRIPAMSAAVVVDQQLVWAEGFGDADIDNAIPATPETAYHLASVTKPIASTMIMQLVEEGLIGLDDPVRDYGVDIGVDDEVAVWHLLTHTSSGVPGTLHVYDGDRFAQLGTIVEVATGASFADLMLDRILVPAGMTNSAGEALGCDVVPTGSPRELQGERVRSTMARPYQLDLDHQVIESAYPSGYSPAAGLISSVIDIAAFDIALDRGALVSSATVEDMFAPRVATADRPPGLSYGLGWYTQDHEGTRLVWHSGRWPPSVSALYLKVPDHDVTFIVAANTPNLTTPFPLGSGDVLSSALALAFYREVLFTRLHDAEPPPIDWTGDEATLVAELSAITDPDVRWLLGRELWARRQAVFSVGDQDEYERLDRIHRAAFPDATEPSSYLASAGAEPALVDGIELSPTELQRYVGHYTFDEQASSWPPDIGDAPNPVRIEQVGSGLIACAGDSPMEPLIPLGNEQFQTVGGPGGSFVVTAVVTDDQVTGLTAEIAPGIELVYHRTEG